MAINENHERSVKHVGYIAASGGGKSQALGQNPDFLKHKGLALLWDTNFDHKAERYHSRAEFITAVKKALLARNKSKRWRGKRIAYTTRVSEFDNKEFLAEFEWFCRVVWAALNGDYETIVVLEELSACSPSAGKASTGLGLIMIQGRKYGGVVHYSTQRPSKISKDVYTQTERFYVGKLKMADKSRVMNECGFLKDQEMPADDLEFLVTDTIKPPEKLKLKYRSDILGK